MHPEFEEVKACQEAYGLDLDSFIEAVITAEKEGFTVIERQPNELLLDLDTPESYKQYEYMRPVIDRMYHIIGYDRGWVSKSGNKHLIITIEQGISEVEAIALQAACGSDPKREVLCLLRLKNGIEKPIRLFKPQQ